MQAATPEVYVYIRTVMSMVIGLSLARLLTGLGGIVQSPGKFRVYWVHLGWVASMFLFIIHFWWWEYRLQSLAVISFGVYLFLISFCCLFFFLCVLLFPTTLEEYGGYEEYYISRRGWFFGMLAVTYVVDFLDTLLKGKAYLAALGWEYPLRNAVYIVLCIVAARTANRRFHAVFVSAGLLYQITWIFRLYDLI
ncbi:hypothetical protein FHX08_001259 [Rhizobium sp. BK529]|uniref:hypothetical protein n=2 Tax=unclassified Rhizobium TaxID=2613769 RepID=UPI00104A2DB0|nr:hypothetical protein [Rhizobium sp. BK418]MBB3590915.1 hypothetical protein [Rhizobium sp. BK529]TCS09131.1 hypothetical protein EV281_1011012 [Rhizobium sp. BK418]